MEWMEMEHGQWSRLELTEMKLLIYQPFKAPALDHYDHCFRFREEKESRKKTQEWEVIKDKDWEEPKEEDRAKRQKEDTRIGTM
ncbi:hypothetical protein OS493_040055 [Desmophyllum pertusum]|uniref:Uncharacterized protein n=1 Tax=Desmophyllum pertusum TaxID=174260 RepID=A0A9X0CTL7_9CNID|nr:hypothetical protein OS493_040055 [Desmophyllum pertusum]